MLLHSHTLIILFLGSRTLKTHYNVTFLKFYKLLEQYSKNEQRFGK